MKNRYLEIHHIWFSLFKRHHCPACGGSLKKRLRPSGIVSTGSPQARDYDFSIGDTRMIGNVECYEIVFHCRICDVSYRESEMMELEKRNHT